MHRKQPLLGLFPVVLKFGHFTKEVVKCRHALISQSIQKVGVSNTLKPFGPNL